jgi:hypothetical protein
MSSWSDRNILEQGVQSNMWGICKRKEIKCQSRASWNGLRNGLMRRLVSRLAFTELFAGRIDDTQTLERKTEGENSEGMSGGLK